MIIPKIRIRLRDRVRKWPFETVTGIREGFLATLLFFLTQLIICGIEEVIDKLPLDFSAPIIAMTLVFVITLFIGWISNFDTTDVVYRRYLKGPTDLLNRHMSIGFTVPLLKIALEPLATSRDVGLIICCFLVTGLLNSTLVYAAARSLQKAIQRLHRIRRGDTEQQLHSQDVRVAAIEYCPSIHHQLAIFDGRPRNCHSETSTLVNNSRMLDGKLDTPAVSSTPSSGAFGILRRNSTLLLCILSIPAIGIPLSVVVRSDAALDISVLFSVWLAILSAQSGVKGAACLGGRPRVRALLSTSLNAVLWTSLTMIGYAWAKTAVRKTTIKDTISAFVTGTDLAALIQQVGEPPAERKLTGLGAGDIALSILNAGIVSWGLKLFECRSQLLSRAGVTVLTVSTAAAAVNVVFGPLLAYAIGLRPASRDLAFAARSVTIALGGPAIEALGADGGLNAVMVVVNGIIFQMLAGMDAAKQADMLKQMWKCGCREPTGEADKMEATEKKKPCEQLPPELGLDKDGDEDAATVATGVAVGINAAAMGTSHLYERNSRAAPYSTLSMTVFGVMTVVFTSIGPLAEWLIARVSQ